MHDINFIRKNPIEFDNSIKKRGDNPLSTQILKVDEEKRKAQTHLQKLLAERNNLSKEIGKLKSKNENIDQLLNNVETLKNQIVSLKELEKIKDDELNAILSRIPNIPLDDVPIGIDENDNKEIKKWGKKNTFNFKPKRHFEIGENLGLMSFEMASKISGSRFVILKGMLSKLERAISLFMLDKHTLKNGYTEMNVPILVKDQSLYGTGNLPKFTEDLFSAGESHWLIPTAEVPLTNLVRDQVIDINSLRLFISKS